MWSAEQSESLLNMQFYHTINHISALRRSIMYENQNKTTLKCYVFKTVNNIKSGSLRFMKCVFIIKLSLVYVKNNNDTKSYISTQGLDDQ